MNIMIELTAPLFCILLGIGSIIGWLLWRKHHWQIRYWLIPVFLCYILLVMKMTLFPIPIFDQKNLEAFREGLGAYSLYYQLIPFASIKDYFQGSGIIQLIGNIALLAPMAVFAEIFVQQRPKAWKVALGSAAVSLLIEMMQLVISLATQYPNRVVDVDDLILNTTGVVIAIVLTRTVGKNQNIRTVFQKILYR